MWPSLEGARDLSFRVLERVCPEIAWVSFRRLISGPRQTAPMEATQVIKLDEHTPYKKGSLATLQLM